jgi:Phage tail lysozyme/D-alanyl-D-alanine carboxypeptidase
MNIHTYLKTIRLITYRVFILVCIFTFWSVNGVSAATKNDIECAIVGGVTGSCGYDPDACGNDASAPSPISEGISGDLASLAKQITENDNISFDFGPDGEVGANFKLIAEGKKALTYDNKEVDVQPIILITALHIAKTHKVNISSLTDGKEHTNPKGPHAQGKGIDINILDGTNTNGTDPTAQTITNAAAEILPNESRFGLGDNNGKKTDTQKIGDKTFNTFKDNPDHVHIDVRGLDQKVLDEAVESASRGVPLNDGSSDSSTSCCPSNGNGGSATLTGDSYGEHVFNRLVKAGYSEAGAAGIIGNMSVESAGVEPQRLQGVLDKKTPAESLEGTRVGGGYGLVQWTPASDKILKAAKPISKANDVDFQIDYLLKELNAGYKSVVSKLKAKSITPEKASDVFLYDFERPADPSATVNTRQSIARAYYNLATKGTPLPKSIPVAKPDSKTGSTQQATTSDAKTTGCAGETAERTAGDGTCPVTKPVWGSQNGKGSQYSQAQLAEIFGSEFTTQGNAKIKDKLVEVDFNGTKVQIHTLAAGCLKGVADQVKDVNYKIRMMGCYRFDSNNGSTNIGLRSYHTYGVACDINWDKNPFVSGKSAPYDMPEEYVKAFHDHGFTWGGYWSSVKDYMHFEFNGIKP